MASGKCVYLRGALSRAVFASTSFAGSTGYWVALTTAAFDPLTDGTLLATNEVVGGGYVRLYLANSDLAGDFDAGSLHNVNSLAWPTVTGSGYGMVRSFYLVDSAATDGTANVYYGSDLPPVTIIAGPGPRFPAGGLVITEN